MNKVVSLNEALKQIKTGCKLMSGGFLGLGSPKKIIDGICENKIQIDTLISSDTGKDDLGSGKIVSAKLCKNIISTHIGTNKNTVKYMNDGTMNVEIIPQGTFVKRIRCKGSGNGGFLTKVGMGTEHEEGKRIIESNGEKYILEEPLSGDVAIIGAYMADKAGNVLLKGTEKSFNIAMAMAAETVIVEAANVVEIGEIDKNCVHIPFIFVDYVVKGDASNE